VGLVIGADAVTAVSSKTAMAEVRGGDATVDASPASGLRRCPPFLLQWTCIDLEEGVSAMAMTSSSVARCQRGRRDDFLAIALEGMKLFERHGARHVRLLAATTAGEQSNSYVLTNEFENAADYGAFVDELYRDAEMDSFLARIGAEDSPLVIDSRSLATEIPLGWAGTRTHGSVIEVYLSRLVPGRFEACRDLALRAFDFLGRHGATNCRWLQLNAAGALNDAMVATWEFENMQAWGTATDAFWTDPAGQPIMEVLMGPDSPVSSISSGIYRDLHM
jgi:hypothetical protein